MSLKSIPWWGWVMLVIAVYLLAVQLGWIKGFGSSAAATTTDTTTTTK